MLRVAPDGKSVWVLTFGSNDSVVLDVEDMTTLHDQPTGKGPVQCAFSPAGGRYVFVTHLEESYVLVLERASGREVQRIDVGGSQSNVSFTADGATAFVTVTSRNEVAAIDMAELAVVGRIPAGGEPMGLVVFDPSAA